MGNALTLDQVSKTIGRRRIIERLSLEVGEGEIFGFLGPNGAGKTTMIRMIAGLIRLTSGHIQIMGHDIVRDRRRAMANLGAIIENPEMYVFLSGYENLIHFARMSGVVDTKRIDALVDLVRLNHRIHDKVKTYSLGMRQRLGIAQALLHRPKLLVLDEPSNGLDPSGILEMRQLFIKVAREEGVSIFISSHILAEVERIVDRYAVIEQGRLMGIESVKGEDRAYRPTIWHVSDPEKAIALYRTWLESQANQAQELTALDTKTMYFEKIMEKIIRLDDHRIELMLTAADQSRLNRFFVEHGIDVGEIIPKEVTLEERYFQLTQQTLQQG